MKQNVDVAILGSSFAGSILGWILAKAGLTVAIIDRAKHPRFAIGESSTPTADFILAYLADRWNLPELRPLAAFGTWQASYPHLDCGKKRGFTYYGHTENQSFVDTTDKRRSRMVAASQSDYWSDTHWMRSDIDYFLLNQAAHAGCFIRDEFTIRNISRNGAASKPCWTIELSSTPKSSQYQIESEQATVDANWIVDSTGNGTVGQSWLGNQPDDEWMKTKTGSIFAHFRGVKSFGNYSQPGIRDASKDLGFDNVAGFHCDDSAQHHVLRQGWIWMLRFQSGITSVGIVHPTTQLESLPQNNQTAIDEYWRTVISKYPSLAELMSEATICDPPSKLLFAKRLSRCMKHACGEGWIAMPTTFGFIDPLHSTGIAHGLSGVMRVAEHLVEVAKPTQSANSSTSTERTAKWRKEYNASLRREVEWLDCLVSGCYLSQGNFDLFTAFSSFYFIAAIQFERVMSKRPDDWPHGYLCSDLTELKKRASSIAACLQQSDVSSERIRKNLIEEIRKAIEPWNDVGLLEASRDHRIAHTAPPKYSKPLLLPNGN